MSHKSWLISWIGAADHECAEGKHGADIGPIASALVNGKAYDNIYLLTNYDFKRSKKYCAWLEKRTGYKSSQVDLFGIDLSSPINYGEIYDKVSRNLQKAGLPNPSVDLTFHTSPGTPAMAAIWILLAKTRFPAKLIQTSRENGLATVDFNFDLANDFLPEFLRPKFGYADTHGPTPLPHLPQAHHLGGQPFQALLLRALPPQRPGRLGQ